MVVAVCHRIHWNKGLVIERLLHPPKLQCAAKTLTNRIEIFDKKALPANAAGRAF
jgi:hypothetical protein